MRYKYTTFTAVVVAFVTVWAQTVRADDVPMRDHNMRRPEKTYYNDTEQHRAHAKGDDPFAYEHERVRSFYLIPALGLEVATIGTRLYATSNSVTVQSVDSQVGYAPAFSVAAGWRLGHFNMGLRYQGAAFVDPDFNTLGLHKVYGELGFNVRHRVLLFTGYIGGGWAFATTRDTFVNGAGGKVGVGFDFLINRFFSLGPGFSFDVHAYRPGNPWVVAYGGTAQLRIGFHL